VNAAWWRDTWLIARREFEERSRARSFRITTAIVILAVAAAVVIPAIVGHHNKIVKVGLLGESDSALRQAAIAAGRVTANRVQVVAVASLDAARAELRSGALAAVIVDGREVLIKQQPVSGTTSSTTTFSDALAQLMGVAQRLPPGAAQSALTHGIALPLRGVEPAPSSLANRFTGLGVDLLIYLVIFFYGMAITQSVGEEKTSRVVEVMLATIRPTQLLTGKVIGFAGLATALRDRDGRHSPARRAYLPAFRHANRRPRQAPAKSCAPAHAKPEIRSSARSQTKQPSWPWRRTRALTAASSDQRHSAPIPQCSQANAPTATAPPAGRDSASPA